MVFTSESELTQSLKIISDKKNTVGFVPTMGALHDGHLSLLKQSISENHTTVISIFVNPTQFNNPEDLKKYPRTIEADIEKIKSVSDHILIFAPSVEEMYPTKTEAKHFDFDGLENQMEGKFRPGHFDGVGTIVKRFFEIVAPNKAYFGEKDFQQLQIIKKLVEKEKLNIQIVGCPIFREKNGLAMSSRNSRLSSEEKDEASIIFKTLTKAKILFSTNSATTVSQFVVNTFNQSKKFKLEYFEIADEATLLTCKRKNNTKKYRAFIAVFVNNVRLIDTISFN